MRAASCTASVVRPRLLNLVLSSALGLVGFGLVGFGLTREAAAQQDNNGRYTEEEVALSEETDKAKFNTVRRIKSQVLNDGSGNWLRDDEQKAAVAGFYLRYLFPAMTRTDRLSDLASLREEVLKDIERASRSGNTQILGFLVPRAAANGEKYAKGNYHPAVRINGALLLGELDQTPAVFLGGNPRPPVPFGRALPKLIELYGDEQNPSGVRVAALLGIRRHARYASGGWSEGVKDEVADLMLEVLESDPPSPEEADQHGWLQRLAITTLRSIDNPRRSDQLAERLLALAADSGTAPRVRYFVAGVMGEMESVDPATPPVRSLAEGWAKLLADSLDAEAERLEKLEKPKATGRSGYGGAYGAGMPGEMYTEEAYGDDMYGGEAYGPGMGPGGRRPGVEREPDPQPPEVMYVRRQVNYHLQSIHRGLDGYPLAGAEDRGARSGLLKWIADDGDGDTAMALRAEIDDSLDQVNDRTLVTAKEYAETLRTLAVEVRALSGEPEGEGDDDSLLDPDEFAPEPNAVGRADAADRSRS